MFKFPKNSQRVSIVGRTGSGKTQFAAWLLSQAPFDKQPYVIIDYKYDDLLNSIDNIKEIGVNEKVKHPGLYITHPQPGDEDGIENFLWKVWNQERVGLYIDEGYMIPKNSQAFTSILTQGRSKKIPIITLTQRPTFVNRFVFSESDYFGVFHLNDKRDHKTIEGFSPIDNEVRTPEYWCRWYDIAQDKVFHLRPVPERDKILQLYHEKLKPKRSFF